MKNKVLDLIILGAGPAGLSASVYASRYKIDHITIGMEMGGYLNEIHKVENYPGFEEISGFDLAQKMVSHAKFYGTKIIQEEIRFVTKEENFIIKTSRGEYQSKFLIYSIGTSPKKIGIPGEKEFSGKGVSFCATCDSPFFKDKKVVVVGGGNAAAVSALILARHAKSIHLFYRAKELQSAPAYIEKMEKNPKIELICETNLMEIKGKERVEKVILDKPYKDSLEFEADGVFVEIGSAPNNQLLNSLSVETDTKGFVLTKSDQSTSVENLFAAGDVTTNSNGFRQIVTAVSEGAVAVLSVFEKLKE